MTYPIDQKEYWSVHQYLHTNYGKALWCEGPECSKKSKNFNWAKKTGCKYEKKRENFIWLCRACHTKYDYTEETRRRHLKNNYCGKKTHCLKGHPYDEENTIYFKKGKYTGRMCRTCRYKWHHDGYLKWRKKHKPHLTTYAKRKFTKRAQIIL